MLNTLDMPQVIHFHANRTWTPGDWRRNRGIAKKGLRRTRLVKLGTSIVEHSDGNVSVCFRYSHADALGKKYTGRKLRQLERERGCGRVADRRFSHSPGDFL